MSKQILRRARPWRRQVVASALAGLVGLGTLTACGGGGNDSASSAGSTNYSQSDSAAKSGAEALPVSGARDASAVSPDSARASAGQKLVRRANLQLKVKGLTEAAQRIRSIASQQEGAVLSEELYSGAGGKSTSGTITISVPSAQLDATIALIEKVGDVQFRNTSTEDVTATYVDTEARVKSMTASVARIRELLSKASSVGDLIALENELSNRQADLDALTAQLSNLKDSVTMSPISISLSTDDFEEPIASGGFLSGLKAGWSAFTASLAVLVTAVGAVLPFAVALALVLAPLAWWLRRRRSARPTFGPPVAQPAGPAGPMPPSAG